MSGVNALLNSEAAGAYPGGAERRRERIDYICQHIRPISLGCLQYDLVPMGWQLYRRSFAWHVRLGRVRYLLSFPLLATAATLRRRRVSEPR